jgi:hypothetical protein
MADEVRWDKERVTALFVGASMKVLSELAFIGEGKVKINITDNGQVDTGFMRSSAYAVTPEKSSYAPEFERRPDAQAAPAVLLPDDHTAALAVAAEYAVYQEVQQSFLFRALEQLASEFNGAVERNAL